MQGGDKAMTNAKVTQVLRLAVALGLILVAVGLTSAEIPRKINYQGRITDSVTGVPLPGGHIMVLRIYNAMDDGDLLWSEQQNVAADSAGVFSVTLGAVTPINIAFGGPCWLEVETDGEILLPRRELVSVPFAFRSLNSDSLGGLSSASFSLTGHTHDETYVNEGEPGSVTADMVLPDIVSSLDGVVNDGGNIDLIAGSNITITPDDANDRITIDAAGGGAGDGHSLDAADGTPVDAVYVDNTGDVGIGTTSPSAKLDVRGALNIGTAGSGHDVNFYSADAAARMYWDESRRALRAGADEAGAWDEANLGMCSLAVGYNAKASAFGSVAFGDATEATESAAVAMGRYSRATDDCALAVGYIAEATGWNSTAIGRAVDASDTLAVAIGRNVMATASYAIAIGRGAESGPPSITPPATH
jgi:hypothetical protein